MKKPIAIAAAVIAIGAAGTAVAAPGGGMSGGDQEQRQTEFAADLARQLDGVDARQVEQGLEKVEAQHESEMTRDRAEGLADSLDDVSVEEATAALEKVHTTLEESDGRPERGKFETLLAAELGVSKEQLKEAHKTEELNRLDQAVKDGDVTDDQADRIRKQIESGKPPEGGPGHGGPGGPGGPGADGPGGPGKAPAGNPPF